MTYKAKCRWNPYSSPSVANCKGCPDLVWEPIPQIPGYEGCGAQNRRVCRITGRIPGNMKTCPKEQP